MKDFGFIESAQGVHGGYLLKRELSSITLSEFLDCLEGPQLLVACTGDKNIHSTECAYEHACDVRPMMTRLNHRVRDFLMTIKLTELTQ
jgi:Rrf2 family protein